MASARSTADPPSRARLGALSSHAAYRRWYAAAGPWGGFFRAVTLVALARGVLPLPGAPDGDAEPSAAHALADELRLAGDTEGWLGRHDVLLLLDLPAALGVEVAARLAPAGVRPVLLALLWPEPGALVAAAGLAAALVRRAPPRWRSAGAQYAFLLEREREGAATAADLAARFDNRYSLGEIDLPSPARLQECGVRGLVACRQASTPVAADLARYLGTLDAAGVPVRRLVLSAEY